MPTNREYVYCWIYWVVPTPPVHTHLELLPDVSIPIQVFLQFCLSFLSLPHLLHSLLLPLSTRHRRGENHKQNKKPKVNNHPIDTHPQGVQNNTGQCNSRVHTRRSCTETAWSEEVQCTEGKQNKNTPIIVKKKARFSPALTLIPLV